MSRSVMTTDAGSVAAGGRRLHPWPVRVMHWINALAILVMIASGWGIYNDDVIINGLHFAEFFRLGDDAAQSLLWHFAGMWLVALNGLTYLAYGLSTGRLRERLLPIRWPDLVKTLRETVHLHIDHSDLTTYNAVQKLLYIVVILAGISQVITGLSIWKPVQFSGLLSLLGGFQFARVLHFTGMSVIVGFLAVHVALSAPNIVGHADGRPACASAENADVRSPFRPATLPDPCQPGPEPRPPPLDRAARPHPRRSLPRRAVDADGLRRR